MTFHEQRPPAPSGVFSLEAFPDVYLKTAAHPRPHTWNGFPVPMATPAELVNYAAAVRSRAPHHNLTVLASTLPRGGWDIRLSSQQDDIGEIGAWVVTDLDTPVSLDGLMWNEHDLAEADLCNQCGASLSDGEGYNGLCGNCADRAEPDDENA